MNPDIAAVLAGEKRWCVVQGDCREVLPTIPDGAVDAVVTDIPYGEVNRPSGGIRNFDKGNADIETFTPGEFLALVLPLVTGSVYVFCGTEQVSELRAGLVAAGMSTRFCIWHKPDAGPVNGQHLWLSSVECCVFGKKPGATFNYFCKSSVWHYNIARNTAHPTGKPVDLMKYLVAASSNPGNTILDPCVGSGTTGVAAVELGRRFIGVEISEEYCRIARERIDTAERQGRLAL